MIEKLHGCFAFYCVSNRVRLLASLFFCVFAIQASATVPVMESVPEYEAVTTETADVSRSRINESLSIPAIESKSVVGENEPVVLATNTTTSSSSNVAHLLNTVEQLRNEVMELRGQFEQQAYLLEQLQKASRDRYLDLDTRIAQLSGSSPSPTASKKSYTQKAPNKPVANNDKNSEDKDYQRAIDLVHEKRFDQALTTLKQQLASYPNGRYTDNVQYWLGEVYMAQEEYTDAKHAFLTVLNQHPSSAKVPDATYKLGRLFGLMGDIEQAKKYLKLVISNYPRSSAARLSDTYLESLNDS